MKFLKNDNIWAPTPDVRMDVRNELPPGNYTFCRNDLTGEYYLEESEPFVLPEKLYGKTEKWSNRIIDASRREENQTGVVLSGTKGSGKTLLSKSIAVKSGLPVLIVNDPFSDDRFLRTVQGISQRAVVLFDEFEKIYDREAQERVLTLFDGVYTARNKIMIMTCNDLSAVQDFFLNRPGRLRYAIEFRGLETDFIKEYCADKLANPEYLQDILKVALGSFDFNFDMLQALVRELNLYGGTVEENLEILNVKTVNSNKVKWAISLKAIDHPNLTLSTDAEFNFNPFAYFNRQGSENTFDYYVEAKGKFNDGRKPSPNTRNESYNLLHFSDLKGMDSNSGTYVFESEVKVHDEEGVEVCLKARILVTRVNSTSILRGGWDFGS